MKKGLIGASIYYLIWLTLIILANLFLEHPRHAPGSTFVLLILMGISGAGIIFIKII